MVETAKLHAPSDNNTTSCVQKVAVTHPAAAAAVKTDSLTHSQVEPNLQRSAKKRLAVLGMDSPVIDSLAAVAGNEEKPKKRLAAISDKAKKMNRKSNERRRRC